MPIAKINENGSVKIYNTNTGETKDVSPGELGSYNPKMVGEYYQLTGKGSAPDPVKQLANVKATQALSDIKKGVVPEKGKSEGERTKYNLAKTGLKSIKNVASIYEKDPNILSKQLIPGKFTSRSFDSALFSTVDTLLRIRTGATAPEEEIRRYINAYGPQFGDTNEDVAFKLQNLEDALVSEGGIPDTERPSINKKNASQVPQVQKTGQIQNLASQIGGGAAGLLGNILSPAVNFGKMALGAGYEGVRAGAGALGDQNAYNEQIHPNPFLSNQDLQRYQNPIEGLKTTAGAMSYAIPFGRGANMLTKTLLPGGAVGGLVGASEENATPESIGGNALLGAGGAGAIGLGAKAVKSTFGALGKISPALENSARAVEQSTRKIRVKPSVYGAEQEEAIGSTLTKYGIKGSPQVQYEALKPTMQKIENKIKKVIEANPTISITRDDIKNSFMDNLKSSLRSKDLTQNQATTEIDGYLKDLVKASGGKGQFVNISLERLRSLKKLVNADYGNVHDIMERGGTLTPRQKVISAAWDSLDKAVKKASPEMKVLLKDESNLYKSAPSLSSARSNPPTFRIMGTSVPASVSQKGKDVLTDFLRGSSSKTKGLTKMSSNAQSAIQNPLIQYLLGQAGARLPSQLQ